ncbi:MAG: hypothetical protein ACREP2_00950, partial [Rhodanobacteraceae bacterium]
AAFGHRLAQDADGLGLQPIEMGMQTRDAHFDRIPPERVATCLFAACRPAAARPRSRNST